MPQPTMSQLHFDRPLTNLSTAYMNDRARFIYNRVFMPFPVNKRSDRYYVYTQNDWFRDEAKPRDASSESVGVGYNLSTDTYYCDTDALHHDIDDFERANADTGINLDMDATELVTQLLMLRKERQWVNDAFTTGVWDTDVVGGVDFTQWSDYATSDPIADIQAGMDTVLQNTGKIVNTLTVGWQVHSQLINHPDIRERINPSGLLTPQGLATSEVMIATILGIPRYIVASTIYATNTEGEPAAYDFIHGKNALLTYSEMSPGLKRASAGYTFTWRGMAGNNAGMAIKRYRMEHLNSDRVEGFYSCDFKITGTNLGYFFSAAVA